jgi:hypothetical protein
LYLVYPQYSSLLYSTLLYSTLLYSTLLYSTLLYSTLLLYSRASPCISSILSTVTCYNENAQAAYLQPDPAKFGPGPYPTIVPVYGGPHVQTVSNSWTVTADLRSQVGLGG